MSGIDRKLLLVAYPHHPNAMFEAVVKKVGPPAGWVIDRFKTVAQLNSIVETAWQRGVFSISQIDVFAHGSPGHFGFDDVVLFDCHRGQCCLGELHLWASGAVVRFLGCNVAADDRRAGWTFDGAEGMAWVSAQLGGLRVEAPKVAIGESSFDRDGFIHVPASMVAAQRKPTP